MDLLDKLSLVKNSACLAAVFFNNEDTPDPNVLSSKELEIFSKISSQKRQIEFIAGRKACKKALSNFINTETFSSNKNYRGFRSYSDISILPSNTGSPVITFPELSKLNVSISHSHGIAIAAVSKNPIGIDIEKINPKKISALKHMNPDIETQDPTLLTVFWTLKEALSKALKTGIVKDFEFYNTKNYQCSNQIHRCEFENFPEYSGIAVTNNEYALAIVQSSN